MQILLAPIEAAFPRPYVYEAAPPREESPAVKEARLRKETAERLVYCQQQADARDNAKWGSYQARPSVWSKSRAFADALARHSAIVKTGKGQLDRFMAPAPVRPALPGLAAPAVIESTGAVHRLGDSDESPDFIGPVQITPDYRFAARIEAAFLNVCREETGQTESAEDTRKRERKEARLRRQGHIVSAALESVGKVGYRESAWSLWAIDVHELTADALPQFRRICLNPWIAYRQRRPVLNWLEYWLQDHPHCRFWTFTSGPRCTADDLEARIEALHRKISKLNNQPFMKDRGAQIVLRATEFGQVEKSGRRLELADYEEMAGDIESADGRHWYHPHSHCIVWLKNGPLPKWRWRGLMESVWAFWGDEWDEGKRIRNARECVKYVVKPGDMVRLAENDPEELGRLHEILFKKHLVQPMGELRRLISASRKAALIPALRWINDRRKWTLIRDPNASLVPDGSDESGFKNALGENVTLSAARKSVLAQSLHSVPTENAPDTAVCQVIGRCVPAFNFRGVKSPRVIVMGNTLDLDVVKAHPLVARLRRVTRADYEMGLRIATAERSALALTPGSFANEARSGAERIRVHTGTITVPEETASDLFATAGPPGEPLSGFEVPDLANP